jgi:chromosome segregation ATPase
LSKALKNIKNIEGEAAQREIVKLRSEVSELQYDCGEKEKSFKILKKDYIKSQTEVQTLSEEKNKLKDAMEKKISEFKASNVEKDGRIASLKAELNRAREEYEAETTKIRQESIEVVVNFNLAQF